MFLLAPSFAPAIASRSWLTLVVLAVNSFLGLVADAAEPATAADSAPRRTAESGFAPGEFDQAERGRPRRVDFVRHVLPLLHRAGCGRAGCHGRPQPKGSLRLSPLAQDPAADFAALTRFGSSPLVVPGNARKSLLLQVATGSKRHRGGAAFKPGSADEQTLQRWINQGCQPPHDARKPESISAAIPQRTLIVGETVWPVVTATWADGTVLDVTAWARFDYQSVGGQEVFTVSSHGEVKLQRSGYGFCTVRYAGRACRVLVNIPQSPSAGIAQVAAPQNYIDRHLAERAEQLGLSAAPAADDYTFARRAFLHITGELPSPAALAKFASANHNSAQKRNQLVDSLLGMPQYAERWAEVWAGILGVYDGKMDRNATQALRRWLHDAIANNRSADQIARDLLLATGRSDENGAVAFYSSHDAPPAQVDGITRKLLGIRASCFACHDDPLSSWTARDHDQLLNVFSTLRSRQIGRAFFVTRLPSSGRTKPKLAEKPTLLGMPISTRGEPLDAMAEWLASRAGRRMLARNVVNRYWAETFGRGLVEPLYDLRPGNPATHPELLHALTLDFERHRFDLKHLLRTLSTSAAFGLEAGKQRDQHHLAYTRFIPRRLPTPVLWRITEQALGIEVVNTYQHNPRYTVFQTARHQAPVERRDCWRNIKYTTGAPFNLGPLDELGKWLEHPRSTVSQLATGADSPDAVGDQLSRLALSRPLTAVEREQMVDYFAKTNPREDAIRDVLWAFMNSSDFVNQR